MIYLHISMGRHELYVDNAAMQHWFCTSPVRLSTVDMEKEVKLSTSFFCLCFSISNKTNVFGKDTSQCKQLSQGVSLISPNKPLTRLYTGQGNKQDYPLGTNTSVHNLHEKGRGQTQEQSVI